MKLAFLTEKYGFDFECSDKSGMHYVFKNENGYIEFYEWEQFGESAIFVKYDKNFREIKLIEEYPKIIGSFYQNHKGFKWLFKDVRKDYWKMISIILEIEIAEKGSLFGLKV